MLQAAGLALAAAAVAMLDFLALNAHGVAAPQDERAGWIIGLSGSLTVEGLAERIRGCLVDRFDV